MSRTIVLDGGQWRLRGFVGVDAADAVARRITADDTRTDAGWIDAVVPGSVVHDLYRAREVPDPYFERNSLAIEWVPQRAWLYCRSLPSVEVAAGEHVYLAFDGVDHAARVYVDGELAATHAGMFVPFEIDVTATLRRPGAHTLCVIVEPAPESEPQVGRTSRVRVHKSRMTYGWDFCPRMIHQGIWRSVTMIVVGDVRLRSLRAHGVPHDDRPAGSVVASLLIDAQAARDVTIESVVLENGTPVAEHRRELHVGSGAHDVELSFDAEGVRPWWPSGMGEQRVYRLRVRARDGGGIVDERDVALGFRRFELARNDRAPSGARGYTFTVNGRRAYVNGWNWTPLDVLYGVPRPDRLEHLIRLARDAHVNLLRVWGGGLIESESFYDACDRAGIMVWQEFIQSSSGIESTPSTDPAYVDLLTAEARQIVPLRASHPSLVVWCSGNELEGPDGPLDDRHPVVAALRDVTAELDPDAAWLPTSPSGPRFHNRVDVIDADPDGLHDVHGPWEHQGLDGQYMLWNRGTALLNSEFGVEGMTNRRTHERLIAPVHRLPATRANAIYRHLGDWWINEPLVQRVFGGRLHDLEQLRRASQFLQAEGLRYAAESNRRRAFRNSGSIPWQFNESYPNAWCTAAVDYYGDPKPAYFGVRRAYEPVHVAASFDRAAWARCASFEAAVWAWNSAGSAHGDVRAAVRDLGGGVVADARASVVLEDGVPVRALCVEATPVPAPLFVLDLELALDDGTRSANRYLLSGGDDFSALLDVEPGRVAIDRRADGDTWRLELSTAAGSAALGMRIEDDRAVDAPGWAEADDDGFDLLPNERRAVVVRWAGAPADARRLVISGWNVERVDVA